LGKWNESYGASTGVLEHIQKPILNPSIKHVISWLMNDKRCSKLLEDFNCFRRLFCIIVGKAYIKGFPLPDHQIKSHQVLFKVGIRIGSVVVEDIDIVESKPIQALVKTGYQILFRPMVIIRSRSDCIACF